MENRKPQPAWKRNNQPQDHKNWNKGQRQEYTREKSPPLPPLSEQKAPVIGPLEVEVYGNDVGQALKVLKTKISKDGILAELKRRRYAEKPSEAKRRKHREALKRLRKSKGKVRKTGGWKFKDKSKVSESRPMSESKEK